MKCSINLVLVFILISVSSLQAQRRGLTWSPDGMGYVKAKEGGLVRVDPKSEAETPILKKEQLIPAGATEALKVQSFDY
ncbi:MAG: hypothetical protein ABIT96_03750, partial [Ferruginibacter sp.]